MFNAYHITNTTPADQRQQTTCYSAIKTNTLLEVWCSGSALVSINEVNLRQARLVLEWMTVSGINFWCGTFIAVCNQPRRSTQPGHPFVGGHNKYGMVRVWVAGKTM